MPVIDDHDGSTEPVSEARSPITLWNGSGNPKDLQWFVPPSTTPRRRSKLVEGVVSAAGVLYKAKIFLLFASLIITLLVYGLTFGWAFGAGILAIIAIHETGHALAIRHRRLKATLPIFIPFLGALINLKEEPRNADDEAFIGIAGPLFGLVASYGAFGLFLWTQRPVFGVLALFGMLMHIFNLMPVTPLDGGRTVAFLGLKAWIPGLIGLFVLIFYDPISHQFRFDPITVIILLFIVWSFRSRLRNPQSEHYNSISRAKKWLYGSLWGISMAASILGYLGVSSFR